MGRCGLARGLLLGTAGPLPEDWTPTNTELLTVTGERTVMPGKKLLSVVVGMSQTHHEFWLADIRDECIVGLDLLAHWGACVDVPGAALCLGNETLPLRSGRSRHGEATAPQLQPRHQCSPAPAPSRRTRAAETQGEPWRNIVAQTSTPQPLPPHTPNCLPVTWDCCCCRGVGSAKWWAFKHIAAGAAATPIERLCGHFCCTRGGLYQDSSGAA